MQEGDKKRSKPLKATVTDPGAATAVRIKLMNRIEAINENDAHGKCICGAYLRKGQIKSYDHEGGLLANGYGEPQWFYVHCCSCRYDTALWKTRIKMADLQKEKIEQLAV